MGEFTALPRPARPPGPGSGEGTGPHPGRVGVFPTCQRSPTSEAVTASVSAFSIVHFSKLVWCHLLWAAVPLMALDLAFWAPSWQDKAMWVTFPCVVTRSCCHHLLNSHKPAARTWCQHTVSESGPGPGAFPMFAWNAHEACPRMEGSSSLCYN